MEHRVYYGECLPVLQALPAGSVQLIYIDPPFNTGRRQTLTQKRTIASEMGDCTGFQGRRYLTVAVGTRTYVDTFDDYLGFLAPRLEEARRVLVENGTIYVNPGPAREKRGALVFIDRDPAAPFGLSVEVKLI